MNFSYQRYWEPGYGQLLLGTGTVSAIANTVTYPIEFVKTRIQVRAEGIGCRQLNHSQGYNPHQVFRQIHETGRGSSQFFEGLSSYLASRVGYQIIRNVVYKFLYDQRKPFKPTNDLSHREKGVLGAIAGGFAAFVTTPLELINTRIIADGGIYKPNRRHYTSIGQAWNQIASEGTGAQGLFRGGFSNIVRAALINSTLTGPYDYINEKAWITFGDMYYVNNTLALIFSTIVSTLLVAPADNIKTRMMIQFPDPTKNRIGYKNYADCINKIFMNEGITGFYAGFYALYYRVFIFSAVTLFCQNQLINNWKRQAGLEEWQM